MSQAGIINMGGSGGAGSPIETLTGNSGGAVPPTGNNVNVVGGGGVVVTGNPGTSTLTITATQQAFTWSDQATSFSAIAENGYFVTGIATATMPATPAEGDTIVFYVTTTAILTIQAAGTQVMQLGPTASAAGGHCASTAAAAGNSITFSYRTTGTTWWGRADHASWSIA